MNDYVRIGQFINTLGTGGIEALVTNWQKCIDQTKIKFDYIVKTSNTSLYEESIQRFGGRIIPIVEKEPQLSRIGFTKKFVSFYRLVKREQYKVIHFHASSSLTFIYAFIARLAGVKSLFVTAHTSSTPPSMNFPRKLLSAVLKLLFVNLFKKRFACSAAAGNWLFGEKNFEILNNGIFVSQFRYSESRRLRIRNELKIVDRFVIGHVGRFEYAKNHRFMIDLFSIIKKKCDNAFLLLVGEGSLKESIIQKVNDMHLEKDVLFLEFTDKVSDLLQAFDVFLFPSIYEGLGIAAIEAQAASLRVVASDSIPKETGITELIEYYSLDNNLDEWVEAILSHRHGYERNDTSELIKKAGYDIEDTCKYLMEQYLLHGA